MAELYSQISIKNLSIKNRIVMPPMVCFGWAGNSGFVTDKHLRHYEARAKGGAGLIILEAHCVSQNGRLADSQLGIWSDSHIEGLSRIADICHSHGARVLVQIHHAGFKTPKSVSEIAVAPSEYSENNINARSMTLDEIHAIKADFVKAAERAKKAGLDGIELHGAHGYLISQFMSPLRNKRQDEYGGSLENRMRFAKEIIRGIKALNLADFIIGYRMGGNEPALEDGMLIAGELEKEGIDLLHISSGISSGEIPKIPVDFDYNWIVYCGTEIKKHVRIPVIVVNGIRTPEQASYLIKNGLADFTAIGRGMLTDPEWANNAINNAEINPCLLCPRCQWFTDGAKCPKAIKA